jgi:hypothetical protein
MLRFVPIAMLLCLDLLGCTSAKTTDVTGTWVVTDKSRQRFLPSAQQKAAAKIVLEANGTFVASEIPKTCWMGRQRLVPNSSQAMGFGNFFLGKASSRFGSPLRRLR